MEGGQKPSFFCQRVVFTFPPCFFDATPSFLSRGVCNEVYDVGSGRVEL